VLEAADRVLGVAAADPVGLQRFVRGLADLREVVPAADPWVVVNRLRGSVVPGDAAAQARAVLARHAGVEPVAYLPLDTPALDAAHATGRLLREVAPHSPARLALAGLAARLTGRPAPAGRRRWLLARGRGAAGR
jgi:Flp pilus assembly CpaE family ATPase